MIRVIIADDHPLVRAGLKHVLDECADMELADEVDNGNDLITCVRQAKFDVVLLDMVMPGRSGIELIKQLKHEFPKLPIIVLSTHKEDMFALRTIKAGVSGYLCKDYAADSLVQAIRKVADGGMFISPSVAELLAKDLHAPAQQEDLPHKLLTDREFQIFLLVAENMGSTEIADRLNLSIKTVSTHKARIKQKMQLGKDSDFVLYALKHHLAGDSDVASS